MAAFETTYIPANGPSFANRTQAQVHNLIGAFNTWNDARISRRTLLQLSDRALEDVGLCRADIEKL